MRGGGGDVWGNTRIKNPAGPYSIFCVLDPPDDLEDDGASLYARRFLQPILFTPDSFYARFVLRPTRFRSISFCTQTQIYGQRMFFVPRSKVLAPGPDSPSFPFCVRELTG